MPQLKIMLKVLINLNFHVQKFKPMINTQRTKQSKHQKQFSSRCFPNLLILIRALTDGAESKPKCIQQTFRRRSIVGFDGKTFADDAIEKLKIVRSQSFIIGWNQMRWFRHDTLHVIVEIFVEREGHSFPRRADIENNTAKTPHIGSTGERATGPQFGGFVKTCATSQR